MLLRVEGVRFRVWGLDVVLKDAVEGLGFRV